jgi:hypothetical protein
MMFKNVIREREVARLGNFIVSELSLEACVYMGSAGGFKHCLTTHQPPLPLSASSANSLDEEGTPYLILSESFEQIVLDCVDANLKIIRYNSRWRLVCG